jgi:hypothetical protein
MNASNKTPKPLPKWCECPSSQRVKVNYIFGNEAAPMNFPYCGRCGRNIAVVHLVVGASQEVKSE